MPKIEEALNEALDTFISVSRSILLKELLKDSVDFIKEKLPDVKIKDI
ncbi:MAG: hypothetical protein ACTSPW_18735 [Promethearchaeota archaeon]